MNRLNGLLSAHLQPSSLDPFGHFLKRFEAFDTWISDLCHLFFWRGALVTTRLTFLMFFLSEASPFRQPSPLFHLSFPRHRGPAPQQGCFTPEVLKASQPPTQISLPCHHLFPDRYTDYPKYTTVYTVFACDFWFICISVRKKVVYLG